MNRLLLNVGNTFTEIAQSDGKTIELIQRISTAEFSVAQLPSGVPVFAASVVPAVTRQLENAGAFCLNSENAGHLVDFTKVDTSTLGADRVANALALALFYPLPAIAVDCGTAITLELVDENRVFRGGAIAPGRKLMRRALSEGTAQLPEVPLSGVCPSLPGNGTVESIRFGVDCGAVGMVKELIMKAIRYFEKNDGEVTVILTGGDAPFFSAALPQYPQAPKNLTLLPLLSFPEKRK